MLGDKWDRGDAIRFLAEYDVEATGVLDFPEFICFCEEQILTQEHIGLSSYLKSMATGFLNHIDRKENAIAKKWESRAMDIDAMALVTMPLGFTMFLVAIMTAREETL